MGSEVPPEVPNLAPEGYDEHNGEPPTDSEMDTSSIVQPGGVLDTGEVVPSFTEDETSSTSTESDTVALDSVDPEVPEPKPVDEPGITLGQQHAISTLSPTPSNERAA